MPDRLNAKAAERLSVVYQFHLTGDHECAFALVVEDGACTLHDGWHAKPSATLTMEAPIFVDLAFGELNGTHAFFKRQMRFKGDVGMALKLHSLFPSANTSEKLHISAAR